MQPKATPLVSIVIPTHNSAGFIAAAVRGVFAQTYPRFEVIVVDDGSTDGTADVLQQFAGRIRYHRQDNQGAAAARNAGIKMAVGELVCFLDADDLWAPNKLELQIEFMAAHRDVGLLFTDAEECEGTTIQKHSIIATMVFGDDIASQIPLREPFRKLVRENFVPTSTVMVRKACIVKAGLFDERLPNAEDRDMWLRMSAESGVACLPQVLARKRSHGANISMRAELGLRSRVEVWKKARRDFPALAPASEYEKMLAGTYQELGFIVLAQGDGSQARQYGLASLRSSLRYVMATRSNFPFRWSFSGALVVLSFIPWSWVRRAWRTRNFLLTRNPPEWAGATGSPMERR